MKDTLNIYKALILPLFKEIIMPIRKTLTSIVSAGVLVLGSSGCFYAGHTDYDFDGKILEEEIKFWKSLPLVMGNKTHTLRVKRPSGVVIKYVDNEGLDLKVDYIEIKRDATTTIYRRDIAGSEVLEEAQRQFKDYLSKILEAKRAKGLTDLKGQ